MLVPPLLHVETIDRAELNRLLIAWKHKMGPFDRPRFSFEAHHALFQNGEPIAVTATSEAVRETLGKTELLREDCVELARLCAARRDLCRAMLRLWREIVFPAIAKAHGRRFAVSYQDSVQHRGDIYRFDGWIMLGDAGGGGRDQRSARRGRKMKLWGWPRAITEAAGI